MGAGENLRVERLLVLVSAIRECFEIEIERTFLCRGGGCLADWVCWRCSGC